MIQSERWQQVQHICEAALKRGAGDRATFLKEACGEDEDLRREVEGLLAQEEKAGRFLEVPALEVAAKALAEDRQPSLLGQRIDSYQVISLLGAGGMGAVYRAHDTRLGREVAIKVLPSAFATDADRLRRFEQEARAAGKLNHPNILAIYDVGTHQGSTYIVCERLEGKTLRDRLKGTALPQRKAIEVAVQVARGLAAAHEKGVVHRDLKPENLFLTSDGRLKILDFGLAKLTRPQSDGSRTNSNESRVGTFPGLVLGTVGYMAPEQVRGEAVDHRADLFNFGAILYEMLSGQRAFRGKSDLETMHAIVKEEPLDLTGLNPRIPSVLQRIIRHCLEKSPQERYQSASDIAFDLEMLTDPASMPLGQQAATAQKWNRLGWIAAAVLALGMVAFATAYFRRSTTELTAMHASLPLPQKMTFPPGEIPAISPDGRLVAFVGNDPSGRSQLYLRALESPDAHALAGTEGARDPFWSPDSHYLAYFGQGKLKKIPVAGGPPRPLADVPASTGGSWSRNGVILFSRVYGLSRISHDGGPMTPVSTTLEKVREETLLEKIRWAPHFLPDGRHFLFTAFSPQAETRGIYAGSLDSKQTKRLLGDLSNAAYAPQGYLLFVRNWTLMAQPFDAKRLEFTGEAFSVADQLTVNVNELRAAFSVSETGILTYSTGANLRELVWFNRLGQEIGRVGPPDSYAGLSLSPDESTLAVRNENPLFGPLDIWLIDLSRGTRSRFTSDPVLSGSHIWSPDGSRIVYSSARTGTWDLYQKTTSGLAPEELLFHSEDNKFATDWSPDGRFITFFSRSEGVDSLWILPLFGDRQPLRFIQSKVNALSGRFTPNGRWLSYISDESGKLETHIRPFPPSAGVWPFLSGGARYPRWRRDGKELFYIAPDGKLMAVDASTEGMFRLGTPKALFEVRAWGQYGVGSYSVTADGQRFLFAVPARDAPPSPTIRVVLKWLAVLKKAPPQ